MKHRKRGALGLILSAAIGLGMIGGAAANSYVVQAQPANGTIVSGAVIRFLPKDDGRPSLHANGAHWAAGYNKVSINQHGEVELRQTIKDASKYPILFAMCQADETLGGQRGIICGASGGTGSTRYRLYDSELNRQLDLTQRSDRHRVMGETANLWVSATHVNGGKR